MQMVTNYFLLTSLKILLYKKNVRCPLMKWMHKKNNNLNGPWGHYVKWNRQRKTNTVWIHLYVKLKEKSNLIKTEQIGGCHMYSFTYLEIETKNIKNLSNVKLLIIRIKIIIHASVMHMFVLETGSSFSVPDNPLTS